MQERSTMSTTKLSAPPCPSPAIDRIRKRDGTRLAATRPGAPAGQGTSPGADQTLPRPGRQTATGRLLQRSLPSPGRLPGVGLRGRRNIPKSKENRIQTLRGASILFRSDRWTRSSCNTRIVTIQQEARPRRDEDEECHHNAR